MSKSPLIMGMRDAFFTSLYPLFKANPKTVFISADNGAPTLDRFGDDLKNQFYTVGIAEQQLIGMAAGFALEGYKAYTYAIAPFITLRSYEITKLDVCAMNLPIVLIGIGAGYAYDIMGPTHHTVEDLSIMRALPNMKIYSPADGVTAAALASISFEDPAPQYLRFDRAGIPDLYEGQDVDFRQGLVPVRSGKDVCIIACGVMVHQAIEVAEQLQREGIGAGVVDLFRIKPLNAEWLLDELANVSHVVTMEEHLLAGGMGSSILELLADHGLTRPVLRFGQNDRFSFEMGGREVIWKNSGLDVTAMVARIQHWLSSCPRQPCCAQADGSSATVRKITS